MMQVATLEEIKKGLVSDVYFFCLEIFHSFLFLCVLVVPCGHYKLCVRNINTCDRLLLVGNKFIKIKTLVYNS